MTEHLSVPPVLSADGASCEGELLTVFLMEADGILASLASTLAQTRKSHGHAICLAELRRSFHALKGCCRMVGLDAWAAASATLEGFVKTWLMQGAAADSEKYVLLERAVGELRNWTAELAEQGLSQRQPEELITALCRAMPGLASADGAVKRPGSVPANMAEDEVTGDLLDLELLPVFLDEGRDLLWQIGDCLQRLYKQPDDAVRLQSLVRTIHTIKGSSRMAGAMRLGQHMHALESRIGEMIMARKLTSPLVDELLACYDQGVHLFDMLQKQSGPSMPSANPQEGLCVAVPMPAHAGALMEEHEDLRSGHSRPSVRIRSGILDKLLNQAGEISISRSGLEADVAQLQQWLQALAGNVARLGSLLRQIEMQSEIRVQACNRKLTSHLHFDPLEFDRYTPLQELTRMLAENVDDVASLQKNLSMTLEEAKNHLLQQARTTRDIQRELMHTRMVQFGDLTDRLQRLVRQMAKETGKSLMLEIEGGAVEIDRSILEKMAGPFEHLLRNAVVHGLESAVERHAAGKDATGHLRLTATQEGNEVMIRLTDDGQGMRLHHIRAAALRKGLIEATQALSQAELTSFIFHPGFSTSDAVTNIAGRGIGLDVVRTEVASLGGRISVESVAGRGAAFLIYLPLSLAVTQVVLLQTGMQTYAVPSLLVEQVVRMKAAEQEQMLHTGSMEWKGRRLPLHGLPDLLGNPEGVALHAGMPVLVIKSGHDFIALLAERVLGNREVVTKNIGPQLSHCIGVVGATVLGDGSIVLILNPIQLAQRPGYRRQLKQAEAPLTSPPSGQKCIMVVDDSITVRRVMQRLLKRAGFQVVAAMDGIDALQQLRTVRPDVLLVDIEMPRMDGFDLVRRVRDMEATARLPIIMITSRSTAKHRQRASELGVDAYLGKPYQDEALLAQIAALLNPHELPAVLNGSNLPRST